MTTRRRDAGEGTVLKRPNRKPGSRWEARLWVVRDGKKVRKSLFAPTEREARAKLRAELRRKDEKLAPTPTGLTVAKYVDGWLERQRQREIAPITVARYTSLMLRHVVPVIGDALLIDLSSSDVLTMLARLKAAGLSETTRAHVRTVLRLALADAVAAEPPLLSRNPAAGEALSRLPGGKRNLPRQRSRAAVALSDGQMRAILDAVRDDRLGPLYRFIAASGFRLSEALGLRWRDVKWDSGVIEIRQTLGRVGGEIVWGTGKNEASASTIPLSPALRAILLEQRRMAEEGLLGGAPAKLLGGRGPLVFVALDGGPLHGSVVTHRFAKLLRAVGIEPITVHALRHAYVSKLYERGVPIQTISRLVRHANVQTTQAIYLHLTEQSVIEAAGRLDDLFAETGS